MKKGILDGRVIDLEKRGVPFLSCAFRYGVCVFDALRLSIAVEGKSVTYTLFNARRHIGRFLTGCTAVGMKLNIDATEIESQINRLIKVNSPNKDCGVRMFAFEKGVQFKGGEASLVLFLLDLEMVSNDRPAKICFSEIKKPMDLALPASVKCTAHYVRNRTLILKRMPEFDDVIHLSQEGFVLETSKANLFFVGKGVIKTPAACLNLLPGVTRETVLQILKDDKNELEFDIEESILTPEIVHSCNEIFLVSTSIGIQSVFQIGSRKMNSFEVSEKLRSKLFSMYRNVTLSQNVSFTY